MAAVVRVDGELGAGPLDGVGHVDVRVPGERVAVADEQVPHVRVAAVAQVQDDVFGQRIRAVGVACGRHQRQHLLDLRRREMGDDIDRVAHAGHATGSSDLSSAAA